MAVPPLPVLSPKTKPLRRPRPTKARSRLGSHRQESNQHLNLSPLATAPPAPDRHSVPAHLLPPLPVPSNIRVNESALKQARAEFKIAAARQERRMLTLGDSEEEDEQQDSIQWTDIKRSSPVQSELRPTAKASPMMNESDEAKLTLLKAELSSIQDQLDRLEQARATVRTEINSLSAKLRSKPTAPARVPSHPSSATAVDYTTSTFPWSNEIKFTAKNKWKIKLFRLCQEGAINAAMDGRDVVVVMPTGGGKSLIYQLPALISKGTTVVVTPLLSLMDDQVYNLRSIGISAEMLNGTTSQDDARAIQHRLAGTKPKDKVKAEQFDSTNQGGIKLIYVTPEKVDQSKTFIATLQKMYDGGLLARIVIDEAHCVSQLGHDYRPSYLTLNKLKQLFPEVPIIALTATAPQKVISDMTKALGMPSTLCSGSRATPNSTVLFTAPLYRPNLRYSFVPKPSSAPKHIEAMVEYITKKFPDKSGLVYCLSRSDTEAVANGINKLANGRIRAAIYHAGITDEDKLRVHKLWREKRIQVVVATNASFGMGIDAPDVRFVLHHSIPKLISNHYQESGRAGRDGLESECVCYVRGSDVSRLAALVYADRTGIDKLKEMIEFAQDLSTCRKLLFARAFAVTHASAEVYDDSDDKDEPCGHCDNCQRDSGSVQTVDYTVDGYRALKILEAADRVNGTVTLAQAVELVRGLKGGTINVQSRKKQAKEIAKVDIVAEAGAKVSMNADDAETMLIRLWVEGYIRLHFSAGMYQTYVYVSASPKAARLTRFSADQVDQGELPFEITMTLQGSARGKKAAKASKAGTAKRKAGAGAGGGTPKRAKVVAETDEDEDGPEFEFGDGDADGDEEEDPEVMHERFRAGQIGNPSSGWNSDGEGGIELD